MSASTSSHTRVTTEPTVRHAIRISSVTALTPEARGPALLVIDDSTEPGVWRVRQILHDPEGYRDWAFLASVDLAASDEAGYAVVHLGGVSCG